MNGDEKKKKIHKKNKNKSKIKATRENLVNKYLNRVYLPISQ